MIPHLLSEYCDLVVHTSTRSATWTILYGVSVQAVGPRRFLGCFERLLPPRSLQQSGTYMCPVAQVDLVTNRDLTESSPCNSSPECCAISIECNSPIEQ